MTGEGGQAPAPGSDADVPESAEVVAAFNDMARSAAFEQHWANKFKKSHMVVVVIALVVLPALLGLLLFRN